MIRMRVRSLGIVAAIACIGFAVLAPTPAFAQQCINRVPTKNCRETPRNFITNPNCACCGDCQLSDFVGLGVEVSRFIFGISGSLALVMLIYGGFLWLTSAGSSERIEGGKKAITAAIFGLLIVFGAWLIVNSVLAALTGQLGKAGPVQILGGTWWKIK
jgi:hypothetical protein